MAAALASIGAPAFAGEAEIVFQRDEATCFRIPSLVRAASGYVLMAERRLGIRGKRICSDDGDIDLVIRRSADGERWSEITVAVDHVSIGNDLADERSPIYDPAFVAVPPSDRMVRVGNQSLAAIGDTLLVLFEARYNTLAACGDKVGCINNPENVKAGFGRSRYFKAESRNGGATWSKPVRIDAEVLRSCADRLVRDADVRKGLAAILGDDAAIGASLSSDRVELGSAVKKGGQANSFVAAAASTLGIPEDKVRSESAALAAILMPNIRVGPGNAAVFPYDGHTRILAPGAPLGFYSDDLGATWTCSNMVNVVRGSERQVADVGNGTLVMTLRPMGSARQDGERIFALSRDGGETWSADGPLGAAPAGLYPDVVAQGSIIGVPGPGLAQAIVANVSGVGDWPDATERLAALEQDYFHASGRPVRRRLSSVAGQGKRQAAIATGVEADARVRLTLSRVYVGSKGLEAAYSGACSSDGKPVRAELTVWPFSAAYSAMAIDPTGTRLLVAFEASDDKGPPLGNRAWNEAIRVASIPVADVGGTPQPPKCD